MKQYFSQCIVLFFPKIRCGKLPAISDLPSDRVIIEKLMENLPVQFEIINNTTTYNSDNWPVASDSSTVNPDSFIATSFAAKFDNGFRKVVGIFSIPEAFHSKLIEEALLSIRPLDYCLGPEKSGGIYLLGMNMFDESLIIGKPWNDTMLSKSIIREIGRQKKILYKLPVLGI